VGNSAALNERGYLLDQQSRNGGRRAELPGEIQGDGRAFFDGCETLIKFGSMPTTSHAYSEISDGSLNH
jgi:hypothetical protein